MLRGIKPFPREALLAVSAAGVLAVVPLVNGSQSVLYDLAVFMIYALIASSWDVSLGYAGVFNWAHLSFFAVGAYGYAAFSTVFNVSPWPSLLVAVGLSVVASLITALPVLRVKGIYVALVTFAIGQILLQVIVADAKYSGGSMGIVFIPPLNIGSYQLNAGNGVGYYYLTLFLLVGVCLGFRWLMRAPFGLSLTALKDREDYAISRGVPVASRRMWTFASTAAVAGLAGALYAGFVGVVSSDLFGFNYLSLTLTMVFLGGVGTIYGPVLGALILTYLNQQLVNLGTAQVFITTGVVLAVLLFLPGGLASAPGLIANRRRRNRTVNPGPVPPQVPAGSYRT